MSLVTLGLLLRYHVRPGVMKTGNTLAGCHEQLGLKLLDLFCNRIRKAYIVS
jgi:hypothetical protein